MMTDEEFEAERLRRQIVKVKEHLSMLDWKGSVYLGISLHRFDAEELRKIISEMISGEFRKSINKYD